MDKDHVRRRLTAIFSADVAGYSRLMESDEVWTVKNLEENKRIISGFIEEHGGRVVDAPGDNMLADFASVLNAVECAVKVQRELKKKNDNLIESRKMQFRIGINLGDVIEEEGRIYGNGVNIAARLEGLAEPGGICISRNVYDQVKTRLDLGCEYLGEHSVKNISEPVRVYRVLMDAVSAGRMIVEKKAAGRPYRLAIYSTAVLILLAVGITGWYIFYPRYEKTAPVSVRPGQTPAASDLKETPRTIAVLPFENLSSEKDQEYFADGVAEELLNSLTRISELEVRGRTSSFYFKGKKEDLKTISNILNVVYILEGSVRKSGKQVRITVKLINTQKDAHIWSETYDRAMDDIFAIQDDIARSVADTLQITLGVGELGRAPGMTTNIAAYEAYLEGRSLNLQLGRENYSQAIEQLEKAVSMDPEFAICWNELAKAYQDSLALIPERGEEFISKYKAALSRVLEIAPETDLTLRIAASLSGDFVEVERFHKKALALAPSNYDRNYEYGWFLKDIGRPKEAINYHQHCKRLEPLSSSNHLTIGTAYELSGNIDAAVIAMKKARELSVQPEICNTNLLIFALEENNRALIDEYLALVINTELLGNFNNTHHFHQAMHDLLDTPEKAESELKIFLNDVVNNNFFNRSYIAQWASYLGEHELALEVYRKLYGSNKEFIWLIWRPIHKEMRKLPGFKDLVRELGLVDYWRTTGNWGEFCRPVGEDDFECE